MTDSLELVAEVNEFLDTIDESGKFEPKRQSKLEAYKTAMLEAGFNAPFSAMIAQARDLGDDEESADDTQDRSKQVKRMRYIASLKKFTLNRLRVALASHRLEQALRESGRGELAEDLPFGGAYVKEMSKGGEMALEGYQYVMGLFQPKRFQLTGASAIIKTEKDKPQTLELDEEDVAANLKALAGKGKIKDIIISTQKQSLIKNHSTRVALFVMAALAGERRARAIMLDDEKKDAQVSGYNKLLHAHGIVMDSHIISEDDRFLALQKSAVDAGYAKKVKGNLVMDEELELKLFKRRQKHRRAAVDEAGAIVYRLLQWYYTCMHADARKSYGAMPAVLAEPNEEQLSVLNPLQPKKHGLSNPSKILFEKIRMEAKNPPLPAQVWGPAFLAWRAHLDAKWAATEFGVDEKAVADALPIVKSLGEQPAGRGSKFLESLKKK